MCLLVAVAGMVESGARLWLNVFATPDQFRDYASLKQNRKRMAKTNQSFSKYAPHRYIGYAGAPQFLRGKDVHNEHGYRGDSFPLKKPLGEYRIVCIGGSTTYTSFIDDYTLSYPYLLGWELHQRGYKNVRVINAGAEGYSSFETVADFHYRVLDLDPDMVIVYQGVNDVVTRMVWPPEAYRGDNSGYAVHSAGWYKPIPLLERSTAIRMLLIRLGRIQSHVTLLRTFNQILSTAHFWAFMGQVTQHTYPDGIFKEVSAMEMLHTNKPVYFERNIESIVVSAKANGVTPVLSTFAHADLLSADRDAINMDYFVYGIEENSINSEEFMSGIAEHNEVMKALADKHDVPLYDFAAVFPKDPSLYITDSVHVNERGSRLKAKMFADYLESSGRLPDPPQ